MLLLLSLFLFGAVALQATPLHAQTCSSTLVTAGYRDFSYGSTPIAKITSEKPEHKLWWHDGFWWGSLWDPGANSYRIHRFDLTNQCWQSVGPDIDDRGSTLSDAMWDGQKLYIVSHVRTGANAPARLYRYTYNNGPQTWSLDSGFPVDVNNHQAEALTIDKDSTGKLWITWAETGDIMVNRSTTDDTTWGTPFALSVSGTNVTSDDISAIIAFGGNKVGIMWSNQNDEKMYFAVHNDGDPDTNWSLEVAFSEPGLGNVADDHINLKINSDASGNVYAVTKTSLEGTNDPLIVLLKRVPAGTWSWYQVWDFEDDHTRPILMIDEENRDVYVFAPRLSGSPRTIYYKKSDLDNISFPAGLGTEFIKSSSDTKVNDPTSTRQPVNSTTGILILASDETTRRYLHNYLALPSSQPPDAPTSLTATAAGASKIDLAWTDNATNETGFKIERKEGAGAFAEIATVAANSTNYQDTGLQASTTYTYRVRAYNSAGNSGYSNEASATTNPPPSPPAAPSNLTATATSSSTIDLVWTDNASDEDGFEIERKTGSSGTYAQIASVGTDVTSYNDTGLSASTEYFYRVRAFNTGGNSAYSNEAGDTTQAPNQPPAPVIQQPVPGKTYTLGQPLCFSGTATDPEDGELAAAKFIWTVDLPNGTTGYPVASGVKYGQATPTLLGTHTMILTVTDSQGAGASDSVTFDVSSSAPANQVPTAVAAASPISGPSPLQVQFSGSSSNDPDGALRYHWDFGDGDTSDVADPVHTYATDGNYTAVLTVTDDNCATDTARVSISVGGPPPPAAPTNLTATASGASLINLAWTDNADNEDGFKIERKTGSGGTYAAHATVSANTTTFGDSIQTPNTPYFYRVRAYNAGGNSDYSNEANATPVDYQLQIAKSGMDVVLNWNAVAEADSYVVYRATRPMFSADTARLALTTTNSYTDAGILGDPDTNHFYQMRAYAFGAALDLSKRMGEFEFLLLAPEGKKNNFVSLCLIDTTLKMASNLADRIGPNCDLVSQWFEASQAWSSYIPGIPSLDFALTTNEVYMVSVTAQDTLCYVGEVPQGHQYTLITTGGKNNNGMMLLMDTDTITTAAALAQDIGPVDLISRWFSASQAYASYVPGVPSTDFPIYPGQPLMVSVTQDTTWPARAGARRVVPLPAGLPLPAAGPWSARQSKLLPGPDAGLLKRRGQ